MAAQTFPYTPTHLLLEELLKQQSPLGEQAGMPMPPVGMPGGLSGPPLSRAGGGEKPGLGERLAQGLGSPLGMLGMNLLSASGPSLTPTNFASNVGNALNATQKMMLDRRLIESKIGLNKAAMLGQLGGGGEAGKPLTELAKLNADFQAGRITGEQYNAKADELINKEVQGRFENTSKLRAEYRKDTEGLRSSLSDLAKSKDLITKGGDPISVTAAFTAFIRSIDNSVVRPAEQAAYNQAQGLALALQNELNKLQGKGPLSEPAKQNLLQAIQVIEDQVNGMLSRTNDFYGSEANKFKLDPSSVTGLPAAQTERYTKPPQAPGEPVIPDDPNARPARGI